MTKKRIGIDVGGTNVKVALVTDEGQIIYSDSVPTRAEMGYEYTVNNIKQAIYDLMKETNTQATDIEGIGFGFPGQVDYKTGVNAKMPVISVTWGFRSAQELKDAGATLLVDKPLDLIKAFDDNFEVNA